MTAATRIRPLLFATASLLAVTGCGKSQPDAAKTDAAKTDDAKTDDAKTDAPKAGATPKAASATAPKGRSASNNDPKIIATLAGFETCKLDAEDDDLAGECPGLDKFDDVIDESEDAAAVERTLVNLLGDSSETVRWIVADKLSQTNWNGSDNPQAPAQIASALTAIATEASPMVARALGQTIGDSDDEQLWAESAAPALTLAMTKLADPDAFQSLAPQATDKPAWASLLVIAAKQNPTLENQAWAALELLELQELHAQTCASVRDVAIALSQAKPVGPDSDDYNPHSDAYTLWSDLAGRSFGEGDAAKDCSAVLPELIAAALVQAKAGTLSRDVLDGVLGIDQREDAKTYQAKLEPVVKAVAEGKFEADMKDLAKDVLEDWKNDN